MSRLARGYAALGVVLFLAVVLCGRRVKVHSPTDVSQAARNAVLWMLGLGFAAVFLLQLSAPFPYDDYQVPLMGMLTVLIVAFLAQGVSAAHGCACGWFVVLTVGLTSFASPLLQEWTTLPPDRFWSNVKCQTDMAYLREVAREFEQSDPGGKELLTQDLYLAVEMGRTVPEGLEMGPFSYFPEMSDENAAAIHVLNHKLMEQLIANSKCPLAAVSGYSFAIAAPSCHRVKPRPRQQLLDQLYKTHTVIRGYPNFGQNATELVILKRRENAK